MKLVENLCALPSCAWFLACWFAGLLVCWFAASFEVTMCQQEGATCHAQSVRLIFRLLISSSRHAFSKDVMDVIAWWLHRLGFAG